MKRVAILSDTHGLLREEVKEELKQADIIIHAGDINTQALVDEMKEYGTLFIVRGNNDKEWASDLPVALEVKVEDIRMYIVHNKKDIPKDLAGVDIIIYGHSHKYEEKEIDGILMLNPGSCGKRRFNLEITMCNLIVDKDQFKIEKINIEHGNM